MSRVNKEKLMNIPIVCTDEKVAIEFIEKQRWGDIPCCPHCGNIDVYKMENHSAKRRQSNYRWRCRNCKKQYTVRIGTIFESSPIKLHYWCSVFLYIATSKNINALEIYRQIGISYKSILFMLNRINSMDHKFKQRILINIAYKPKINNKEEQIQNRLLNKMEELKKEKLELEKELKNKLLSIEIRILFIDEILSD